MTRARTVARGRRSQESSPRASRRPVGGDYAPSVAERLAFYQRAGGIVTPLLTALIAFLIGGLVVLATGHNPLSTYQRDLQRHRPELALPVGDRQRAHARRTEPAADAARSTTPLILTGLAVAFAFRCGMFNIGGQGQYIVGSIAAVWVGSSFANMPAPLHIVLAIVVAMLAGARWARYRRLPEGDGRRARGDHDDHAQLDRVLGRQ